jgi:hypothetical protein
MIKRINSNIILENKFVFIFGNTNDIFCNNDFLIINLEFFLKKLLSSQYEQVLIFGNNTNYKKELKNRVLGPLGNISLIQNKEIIYEKSYINDILFIDENINKNNSISIIFNNSELLSSDYLGETSFKFLKRKLIDWEKLTKDIKFIFVFKLNSFENLNKILENNNFLFLKNYVNSDNSFTIDYPDKKEIYNLINNLRLRKNMVIDWCILKKIVEILHNERITLKDIYFKFNKISLLNKDTLNRLIDEKFLKKTNKYLIDYLDKEFSFFMFINLFDKLKEQDFIRKNLINLLDIWYKSKNKTVSFVLIGESFVGKTLTVEIVYEIMKNLSYKLIVIDNNNYKNINIENNSIIVFENVEYLKKDLWKNFLFLFKENSQYNGNNIIFLTSNVKIDIIEDDFLDFEIQNKIRKIFMKINKDIFINVDYFLPYKNTSKEIKYKIIKDEINKIVKEYDLNLISIDEQFINKYLRQNINSDNIKDIKNNIRYSVSNIIISLKKENPEIKNIKI